MLFVLGGHTLDTDRRELRRGDDIIAVEPQVFDLLVYLIENRDRVVSKDDLIASVWHNRIVSDSTLTSRINAARKALGDSGGEQKLIRTVPRKGLRFVGEVRAKSSVGEPGEAAGPLGGLGIRVRLGVRRGFGDFGRRTRAVGQDSGDLEDRLLGENG